MTADQFGGLLIAAGIAAIALIWISPWLLLPLTGLAVARTTFCLPRPLQDPVERLGWLTMYSTLPVGIAGLALAIGKKELPADDYLWLMLRIYDLHQWTDNQVWLKPVFLAPLLGAAGILAIIMARPGIIAWLGWFAGLAGQAALSLYVLSLFSLVTPGPFELKLDEITAEMRDRLQLSLQLQQDAEKKYLADKAVAVLLSDKGAIEQSHVIDVIRDAETIARRLGCRRDATPAAGCGMTLSVRLAFEQSLPQLEPDSPVPRDRTATGAPDSSAPLQLSELPVLTQAANVADATTDMFRKRSQAVKATIDAMIDTLADLLPFGELANSAFGDLSDAIADRYGDPLIERAAALGRLALGALDQLSVSRIVADVPRAIAQAATALHDAVLNRGPWVLALGPNALQEELDRLERTIKDIETTMPRSSTVNAELMAKRIRERGVREGVGNGSLGYLLEELKRVETQKAIEGR
jgi:hypothetical protein